MTNKQITDFYNQMTNQDIEEFLNLCSDRLLVPLAMEDGVVEFDVEFCALKGNKISIFTPEFLQILEEKTKER